MILSEVTPTELKDREVGPRLIIVLDGDGSDEEYLSYWSCNRKHSTYTVLIRMEHLKGVANKNLLIDVRKNVTHSNN